jgi:tetratricopeptide (TPR) repeat protein
VIDELRALELIYEKAAYPELAFMFKHALTRDVAYDSVLVGRRKALHRIVATAIEELYQDRLVEQVEHLAHHFTAAEVWEKAFSYRVLAARKAAEAFANQSAAEHCRRALEIAARPDVQVPDETRRELEVTQGMAGAAMSEFRDSGEAFLRAAALSTEPAEEALNYGRAAHSFFWGHLYDELVAAVESSEEVSQTHGLVDGLAFSKLMRGFQDAILGEHASSRRLIQEAVDLEPQHPEVRIVLGYLQGEQDEWDGEYRRGAAAQLESIELARKHRLPGLLLPAQWFRAKALCCLGEYGDALRLFREACELSERIGDRAQLARMLNTVGWVHAELGSDELAAEYNQRSARMAEQMLDLGLVAGTPEIHGNASVNLACNRIAQGDPDGADEALQSVRRDLEADGDPWMRWRYALHRCDAEARLALSRGDPETALRWLEEEVSGARHNGSRKVEARAFELRGRALLHMDDRESARTALHGALELARTIGYPPVQWRALSLLGEIDRRQGDGAAADEALHRAAGIIENLSGSLEQAELRRRFLALAGRLRDDPMAAFR